MPESVLTQTMPLLFAGGGCCCAVGVPFSVAADFVEPPELLAGALEGAGAGAGVGLEFEPALDELDADEDGVDCDASADASDDFFVRFFLVVVALESLEVSALAELAAG
jgi:hypothetical protein